ncbi:hypothetical protein [Kosakonia quasisacchari]|uniref:hypothetical protein n=1 Tax=Kosakonia quasisacchari TaxID=2529380 RepID=UPI0039E1399A
MKINAKLLIDYLDATLENSTAHAKENPQLMHMVIQMDGIFQKEIFEHDLDVSPIAGFLAMNSYMMLLSAVQQALSGHVVAIFPIIRTALESACYAYLITHDEAMGKIWLNRHESKKSYDKCRKMFTVRKASNELANISPEMSEYVMAHYEAAIDFGAHPNQKAVFNHLKDIGDIDANLHGYELIGVYGRNSWHVNYALLVCTEVGQAIAFLLAASANNHPLLNDRLEVFTNWLDEKNRIADEFNGEPINYPSQMYCSVTPSK